MDENLVNATRPLIHAKVTEQQLRHGANEFEVKEVTCTCNHVKNVVIQSTLLSGMDL